MTCIYDGDHLSFSDDKELRAVSYRSRSSISRGPAALSQLVNVIRQTSSDRPTRDRLNCTGTHLHTADLQLRQTNYEY